MKLRSLLRDAGIGLGVTAVLCIVAELALWGAGVPLESGADLSRGFDAGQSYLIPHPEIEGGWRTRLRGGGKSERSIPPKGEETRVLLFGGSNTDNLSQAYFERALDDLGGRDYEVFNLGRSGYGTARVSILFREALERLDPDVVVIYAGHNEFVERAFRMDVEEVWEAPGGGALRALARHSRTVAVVSRLLEEPEATAAGADDADRDDADVDERADAQWRAEYGKFQSLTYDQTLAVYEDYADNLRRMCRTARERDVHVILSTVVHNRMAAPFVSGCSATLDADQVQAFEGHLRRARKALPPSFAGLLPRTEKDRIHGWDWRGGTKRRGRVLTEGPEARPRGFRPCTGPLSTASQIHPPREQWNDKVHALLDAHETLFAGEPGPEEHAALLRAQTELEAALALCPTHARALFESGLVALRLGRDGQAVELLERSGDLDRASRRANGVVNGFVAEVAAEVGGVVLYDADAAFRSWHPLGLVGWEWMRDHCHLNESARTVLCDGLAAAIHDAFSG